MKIGIIGYGNMGSAIFKWLSQKFHNITVFVRHEEKAIDSQERFFRTLERRSKRGVISGDDLCRKKAFIKFTHRLEDIASAQLVIETITEDYDEKVQILRSLESVVDKDTFLVTNTSSISIQGLAGNLRDHARFCGLHFFHPVMLINLVEIIKWGGTSESTISFLTNFCRRMGKNSILVHDAPGSLINTILAYYYLEALYILEEGLALPSKVDEIAKRFFYIGACESMDVIGIDFFLSILKNSIAKEKLSRASSTETVSKKFTKKQNWGERGFPIPSLFEKLVSEKRFGKKVSSGIYLYPKAKAVDDVPEFYLNPTRTISLEDKEDVNDVVSKRLLFSVFNGSLDCYKRLLSTLEELDLGVKEILQMQQGPFSMMRTYGTKNLKKEFDFLSQKVGERFTQNDLAIF